MSLRRFLSGFLAIAVGMVMWGGVAVPASTEARDMKITLDITPQPLDDAIHKFAQQSGLQVVFYSGVGKNLISPHVVGTFTTSVALEQLLANTSLAYEFIDARTVAIVARSTVSASGEAGSAIDQRGALQLNLAQSGSASGTGSKAAPGAAAANSADAAAAAEAGTRIDEIVVTAQKRAERAVDVPMSITAISGDTLNAAGINNAMDLSFVVPGMSVAEPGAGMQLIIVRGIASIRGSSPLTSTYLDDMPVSGLQTGLYSNSPDLRIVDIDRVEVLKGPQGTLFGEGAAGGVIRYITKDPDLANLGGSIATEFSDTTDGDWSGEVTGVLNVPVVRNVFGIRVAAQYLDQTGWIDQPSIGRENVNDSEVKHVRVKALYQPLEKLTVKALAEIHRNDGGANNIVNRYPLNGSEFVQAVNRSRPTNYENEYDMFNLSLAYDFGFAELLSSSSRVETQGNQRFTQVTAEPTPYLEIDIEGWNAVTIFNQELRLTSGTEGRFEWVVGGNYKKLESETDSLGGLSLSLFGGAVALSNLGAGIRGNGELDSRAIFADAGYEIVQGLKIGGGIRYFEDDRSSSIQTSPDQGDASKSTYRLYAKYEVSPATNLYATWGTGFRSGSFNAPTAVLNGAPVTYEPDESEFYELGLKISAFDGRLRLDTAVYYGEYKNMQEDIGTLCITCGSGLLQYTANGQDAEIRGVEASIEWRASERLRLSLAGDITDTEITFIDPAYVYHSYNVGDPINYVPKYSLSTHADYNFNWSSAMPGFIQLAFNRKGKAQESQRHRYGGITLTDHDVSSQISFLNARIGGEWNTWEWSLFGRNLLDEERLVMPSVTGISAQARPRTFGISLQKSF